MEISESQQFLELCRDRYYQYAIWNKENHRNNLAEYYFGLCEGLDFSLRVLAGEKIVLVGSPHGYEGLTYKKF